MTHPSLKHIKVKFYHFTPDEIQTLFDHFLHIYIDPNHEDITDVVNHICRIVDSMNEFSSRDNKTT